MRYEIGVNGRTREVVVTRLPGGEGFAVSVDGRTWHVDAARVDAQTLSLLVKPEVLGFRGFRRFWRFRFEAGGRATRSCWRRIRRPGGSTSGWTARGWWRR